MGYIDRMFKRLFTDKDIRPLSIALSILGILLIFIPYILTRSWFSAFDLTEFSNIGETIGGTTAPFIAFAGVILTFAAFYIQFDANREIRKDISRDRFESKFYEMLRLHRANVEEMEIDGRYTGRRVFIKIYNEYRFIYQLLDQLISKDKAQVPETWKAEISYHYCFWGVFSNTKPIVEDGIFKVYEGRLIKRLKAIRKEFKDHKDEIKEEGKSLHDNPFKTNRKVKNELEIDFAPFGGHTTRLGHYYRHLYQTIKMAISDKSLIKKSPKEEFESRYAYVKMLRVQLSNHEQALIYFNSFFTAGTVWWYDSDYQDPWGNDLSYFLDYAFIKNVPFNLTDNTGPDPEELFLKEIKNRDYSEEYWQKSRFRNINEKLDWLFEWRGG